jgi:hypothetical protein
MAYADGTTLSDLCPKFHLKQWRKRAHQLTGHTCVYCGRPSQSIDHLRPRSKGGTTHLHNCAPACLSCNGRKGNEDAFEWYTRQRFFNYRRAQAIRAWQDGDLIAAIYFLTLAQSPSIIPEAVSS